MNNRGKVMGGPKVWTEQEIRLVLEELRDAAGTVQMELGGTSQHRRGYLAIEGLVEPNRKAYCVWKGCEYLPPPPDDEQPIDTGAQIDANQAR